MFFTKRFTKDVLISIFFLVGVYIVTHNPITHPTPKPKAGLWSIQFMQHPLLFGFAGHNYLALRDGNGTIIQEFHGLATSATTKNWKYIGTNDTDILQVWEFNGPKEYLSSKQYPGYILIEGAQGEILARWSDGARCMTLINEKQIPYPPFGFRIKGETVNSNSVAYTLALCMNLDTRHLGLFTPGSEKNLLEQSGIRK